MKENTMVAFRPDQITKNAMEKWLEKNPDINRTTLLNMAIKKFVTEQQFLESIDINTLQKAKKSHE